MAKLFTIVFAIILGAALLVSISELESKFKKLSNSVCGEKLYSMFSVSFLGSVCTSRRLL